MTSRSTDNDNQDAGGENALTDCLLSQYRFCAAGVGLGTAYSLRYKKGIIPMVAAGAMGTAADMLYGVFVECAQYRNGGGSSSLSSSLESTSVQPK